MMDNFGPIILIEVVLVFGGVLLFAWWQLRDLRKEREKDQKKKRDDASWSLCCNAIDTNKLCVYGRAKTITAKYLHNT